MYKEQSAAIKFNYPIIFRISGLTGLLLTIFSFLLFPRFTNEMVLDEEVQIVIEQIDIPQTEQFDRPPPPARPSVPVESESEDVADDVTLDEFNLDDFDAWDAPPPPPEKSPLASSMISLILFLASLTPTILPSAESLFTVITYYTPIFCNKYIICVWFSTFCPGPSPTWT